MSVRDEGATHYFGDDCPGGHRAANVAGVDWGDQLTADEANERDAATAPTGATGAPKRGDVYRALASAQAARWGYVHTLDPAEYAAYIDQRAQDANLRADVDTVTALVRGQVVAAQQAVEEQIFAAWDAVVVLLNGAAKDARGRDLSADYAAGWADAASAIAETVAEMRAKRSDAKEADGGR